MIMTNIFIDWAVKKFTNDSDLGQIFRRFYILSKEGGNTPEASRKAEEQIMTNNFN